MRSELIVPVSVHSAEVQGTKRVEESELRVSLAAFRTTTAQACNERGETDLSLTDKAHGQDLQKRR